ncbi:hypothetical protein TNCV_3511921 [Trichonephila clavipes]|nr:hypothetical protein TNCV_3511921 [Trichonephila clavipes]
MRNNWVQEGENECQAEFQWPAVSNTWKHRNVVQVGVAGSQTLRYRNYSLSNRSIAVRVGRDPMTVSRILNQWFQDGNMECQAGSLGSPITISREDRHVSCMA